MFDAPGISLLIIRGGAGASRTIAGFAKQCDVYLDIQLVIGLEEADSMSEAKSKSFDFGLVLCRYKTTQLTAPKCLLLERKLFCFRHLIADISETDVA